MCSPKRARARHLSPPKPVTTTSGSTGKWKGKVTIGKLSDKVLLKIFRYYLDASPGLWPRLVQTCRKWRHIVFASQRALNLRLFCTHGTPVSKILEYWPTLPIVVNFGGSPALDPPGPEDEDNIKAALKQSGRITSINLTVTSSLLDNLSAIGGPFSRLEDLVLLSRGDVQLTLPSSFRWGPRLRSLHLTRITLPTLTRLLYSSRNLIDIQLQEVINTSPATLVDALSRMTQLQFLSLHFASAINHVGFPSPSGGRFILPALIRLNLRGIGAYSEGFVARIDAPRLRDIEITFFNERIRLIGVPELRDFIDRIELQKVHRRADILSSERAISISLTRPEAPTCLRLQVLCETLRSQPFCIAQICSLFSSFLLRVNDLRISTTRPPSGQDGSSRGQWLGLIRRFTGAKWLHVAGDYSTDVARALQLSTEQRGNVLPSLHKLCIREPEPLYAPLREAVVSFMHSCSLFGRFIVVEYEKLWVNELSGTGPFRHQVTIEMLSDDVLLKIFLHFLDGSSQSWPMLVNVSQRWRHIIFTSPLGLDLRLHCTYGAPVPKTLYYWPTPIVVNYGGFPNLDPPSLKDEDNIVAALRQSGRVSFISLTLTRSLLGKLSTIKRPLSNLEDLVLLSRESVQLTLPSDFQWGPHLRRLHLTGVVFPALLQRISSSSNLVHIHLHLHEISRSDNLSPEAFANALSRTPRLQSMSLHFPSTPIFISAPPQSGERVLLPALTRLTFRGITGYLEGIVARIDAPRLGDIEITFSNNLIYDVQKLGEFIGRIEMQKVHRQADILFSEHAVTLSLTQPGAPTRLKLQVLCKTFRLQPFCVAQICIQFSAFLSRVEDLRISMARPSGGQDGSSRGQWLELIRRFRGTKWFHVAGEYSTDVVRALQLLIEKRGTVPPALHKLCIREPEPHYAPLREAVKPFMHSWWLGGHFIAVEYKRLRINKLRGTAGPFCHQVTIEILSDDILLEIFLHFLDGSSQSWPTLVQVSQRWREILYASPLGLDLRLNCTYGMPVLKALECSPRRIPLVVNYGGSPMLDPPAPEDEENIVAAIKQFDRVSSISLTLTRSLLEKVSAIKGSYSTLEELVLLSRDGAQRALPSDFQWGPHLRRLHLTGIVFPALLQRIYSSGNLVDIQLQFQLHEISLADGLSPEAFANALSGTPRLQSISLHFPFTAIDTVSPTPPREHITLPALTCLYFRGITGYLEGLVARIDAPRLGDIEITLSNSLLVCDVPKLGKFIDRIEMQKVHRRADILFSGDAVSLSLTQPGAPTRLKLEVFCKTSRLQPFCIAQICGHFSASLFRVEDLHITMARPSRGRDSSSCGQWIALIRRFRGAKWFRVAGDYSTNVVRALQPIDKRRGTVLPDLHKISIRGPEPLYAPLREAVEPFMRSYRLSGRFIAVEYERLLWTNEFRGADILAGPFCHQVTIEILSDDILLEIFLHFLDGSSQSWPTLVHVSQRWRHIIFASPLGLDLRLYCTYGTPVLKTLDCWPCFPLVVNYGGTPILGPPTPQDEANIIAALKQSDRVSSISLTVSGTLLEQLSTIPGPFSGLEKLVLLSRDNMQQALPSAFRWGPHLRSLHSTRIAFPSLPQLLSLSQDIVDLQLHEIPRAGYFPPEAFTNALSGMTQLRQLSLHFLSLLSRSNHVNLPPPAGERVVLPALTNFKYRGTSKYLDSLVARIDAPGLGDIDITFFSQPTMDASQLGRFVNRIEIQRSNSRAKIQIFGHAISIRFTHPRAPARVELRISCEQLDWQLSCMAQICNQFSPFLLRVEDLDIEATKPSTGQDDMDSGQWPELIRPFIGVKDFRVAGELATAILHASCQSNEHSTTILPTLRELCVPGLKSAYGNLWEAASSFITSRWTPGGSVQVPPPSTVSPVACRNEEMSGIRRQYFCGLCNSSFAERQGLSLHNTNNHVPPVEGMAGPESQTASGEGDGD
ncbi:hypothetical protein H4582DRAFT_822012 [Lactarius indigo]|nr:hypothetical protein H4582DRAFT_822012 [Lactarius indigo]